MVVHEWTALRMGERSEGIADGYQPQFLFGQESPCMR